MRALLLGLVVVTACGGKQPPRPPAVVPDAGVEGCIADEGHCCLPSGELVVPGGCQPVVREGTYPNVERNDDGTCREIPCQLRCLPAIARIATPHGDVAVSELAVGDPVWTVDERGTRIETRVLEVRSRPVIEPHQLVEVTLADGRVVRASAGHPLATAGTVGALAAGATLDGSRVTSTRIVPYDGVATWDLLPAGPTGAYWSDGVLLGSTLAR